jgi:nitrite reductase/ring-hydroxylating ferredoxin subunit/uncharacterized membrane protein
MLSATAIDRAIQELPGLAEGGKRVAGAIHGAVMSGGEAARSAADVLHGTFAGHPLHPALTDAPIGAWTFAAIFDMMGARGQPQADWAADQLVRLGVLAAIPTALAGAADYSTIKEDAAAPGALHAILNSAALGLFLLSMRDRSSGQRSRGRLLSTVGLALVGASAALGGELVYRHRVGVNHTERPEGPKDWKAVMPVDDLGQREPHRVEVDGTPALVYRDGQQIYAIGAVCSHAGGPLEEGRFEGFCVQCPWHDSVFDMRNGSVRHGPATVSQPAYEARVRNGQVELRLAEA